MGGKKKKKSNKLQFKERTQPLNSTQFRNLNATWLFGPLTTSDKCFTEKLLTNTSARLVLYLLLFLESFIRDTVSKKRLFHIINHLIHLKLSGLLNYSQNFETKI